MHFSMAEDTDLEQIADSGRSVRPADQLFCLPCARRHFRVISVPMGSLLRFVFAGGTALITSIAGESAVANRRESPWPEPADQV